MLSILLGLLNLFRFIQLTYNQHFTGLTENTELKNLAIMQH